MVSFCLISETGAEDCGLWIAVHPRSAQYMRARKKQFLINYQYQFNGRSQCHVRSKSTAVTPFSVQSTFSVLFVLSVVKNLFFTLGTFV